MAIENREVVPVPDTAVDQQPLAEMLKSGDPFEYILLDMYLHEVRQFPLLTGAQQVALAEQFRSGKDISPDETNPVKVAQRTASLAARRTLVTSNLAFVVSVANRYKDRKGSLSLLDLIQEGNLGLDYAVEKYVPESGNAFITYAYFWIKKRIIQSISDNGRVVRLPQNAREKISTVYKAAKQFRAEKSREPTPEELAKRADLAVEELARLQIDNQSVKSLDKPYERGSKFSLGSTLADDDDFSPEAVVEKRSLQDDIRKALGMILDEKQVRAIELRYLKEYPVEMVAAKFGMTNREASIFLNTAMRKLRKSEKVSDLLLPYLR